MEINEFLNSGEMAEAIGEDGDVQMTAADKAMSQWITQAAATLEASEVPPLELREHHLADAIKDAINDQLAGQAVSKVLDLDAWPSLGRSATDVVVLDEPHTGSPTIVAELKWCQLDDDKVHEAIWDLFKVALLVDQYAVDGYLVTAAPVDIWPSALCGELFSTGTFASGDLFARQFPKGRPAAARVHQRMRLPGDNARGPRRLPGRVHRKGTRRRPHRHRDPGRAETGDGTRRDLLREAVRARSDRRRRAAPHQDLLPRRREPVGPGLHCLLLRGPGRDERRAVTARGGGRRGVVGRGLRLIEEHHEPLYRLSPSRLTTVHGGWYRSAGVQDEVRSERYGCFGKAARGACAQ